MSAADIQNPTFRRMNEQMRSMNRVLILMVALVIGALRLVPPAQAQQQLTLYSQVNGSVDAGSTHSWTFSAHSGEVLSFQVEAASASLDPRLTIIDRAGNRLIDNDDYAYPETRDSLLEAITMPRTETYTAIVSGFNGSAGEYTLTMLPGFARLAARDGLGEGTDWTPIDDELDASLTEGRLSLSIAGNSQRGAAFGGLEPLADVGARVLVQDVSGVNGWIVGLATRRNGDDYYLLEISDDGLWRFSVVQDGEATTLRDWINHPNIVPGKTAFSLSVIARDTGFEFLYDDGYIGMVSDATLTEAGEVGLTVAAVSGDSSQTAAVFSDLALTTPLRVDGERIIPQEVSIAVGQAMALALQRRHVVSPSGAMSLTVPEATVEYARPGVQRLMLGGGIAYTNFALGGTVDIVPAIRGQGGCGLVFRFASETDYTLAFLDATGGYGVSQRQGENFLPGLFGESSAFAGGGSRHLLVISDENTVYFYVDGSYVGTLENPAQEGQVGAAVVNFEGITTTCRYSNLWLWEWD